jgi:hypothetical protein
VNVDYSSRLNINLTKLLSRHTMSKNILKRAKNLPNSTNRRSFFCFLSCVILLSGFVNAQFTAPQITSGGFSDVKGKDAWVYSFVNAGGREASVLFEYTSDISFTTGILKSEAQLTTSNTETLPVGIVLSDLIPKTTYYFRAVGTNQFGSTTGPTLSFKTPYIPLVIQIGDFVPGNAVQKVDALTPGLIADDGLVALTAIAKVGVGGVTTSNSKMLLRGVTNDVSVISRQGLPFGIPSISLLGGFTHLTMNINGVVHFQDQISGASADTAWGGFIYQTSSGVQLINRKGDQIFTGAPVTFFGNDIKPAISSNGTAFFASTITTATPTLGRNGVWFSNGAISGQVARETVVCLADGAVCGRVVTTTLVGSGSGSAFVTPFSGGSGAGEGILHGSGPLLQVVAAKLDKPPGLNPIVYSGFRNVSAGSDTQFSFVADLFLKNVVTSTNDQILMASNAGVQSIVAREGSSVAGIAGGIWDSFGRHYVTTSGDVFFQACLRVGGAITTSNDGVICRWSAGVIDILAREGSRALGQRSTTYRVFTNFSVHPNGSYLIQAVFSDGRVGLIADGGIGQRLAASSGGRVDLNFENQTNPTIFSLSTHTALANLANGTGGFGNVVTSDGSVFALAYVGKGRYIAYVF